MVGIMDTGSDLIWTQCIPCTNCFPQLDPIFDPSNSSTYNNVSCATSLCSALPDSTCARNCQYLYRYGDGSSTRGVLSSDTLTMSDGTGGGQHSIPGIAFGCSHDTKGDDFVKTDGIVGLGRGSLSLISQLGSLVESKFSYCLMSVKSSASETSPLLFGSAADVGQAAKSTPMLSNSIAPTLNTFYYISVEGISVGDTVAKIPEGTFDIKADGSGGFIIDSGTTVTFLPHAAFAAVADILDSAFGLPRGDASYEGLSLCYRLSSTSTNVTVPDITFHLGGGADYVIKGEYNFAVDGQANLLCLLMLDMGESLMVPSILGNYQQQNYHILFDNGNHMLSFAPADCASL